MATPQSTTSLDASGPKKLEQITFRFCSECSNMLYPKEDEDAHKLQFTCRTCQYTEDAQSTCVFRNVLNSSSGETAGVTQDVGSDPTVSEVPPVLCLNCGIIIYCDTCGDAATEICLAPLPDHVEYALESMGLCQFTLPWGTEDPMDEYDEELMENHTPSDTTTASSERTYSHSDSSEGCCHEGYFHDGAMIIDL